VSIESAGIHTSTQFNGSTLTATLLPGSYSSTPSISSSNVLSTYFSPNMVLNTSIGFASTGSEASSINVVLLAGVISYSNTLYQGIPNYSPLSSINSTTSLSSTNSSSTPSSLLISSGAFVILSSPTSPHSVIYDSIPDISQLPSNVIGSSGVGVTLRLVQSSMCVGGCSSGGICGSEGKCICSNGFTGDSCSEFFPIPSLLVLRHRLIQWRNDRSMFAEPFWQILLTVRIIKWMLNLRRWDQWNWKMSFEFKFDYR
jgi:hypothetical protein